MSPSFIKQQFRVLHFLGRRLILAGFVAGSVAFIDWGVLLYFGNDIAADTGVGLQGVESESQGSVTSSDKLRAERNHLFRPFDALAEVPFSSDTETKKVLILGDSMSRDLYGAVMVNKALFDRLEFRRMRLDEPCMPYFARFLNAGEMPTGIDGRCRSNINRIRNESLFKHADTLVLSAHWPSRAENRPHLGAMALAETLAAQGRQVLIVGLVVMQDHSSVAFQTMTKGLTAEQINEYAYSTRKRGHDQPNADVRALAERVPNIGYLDKYGLFCNDERQTCALFDEAKQPRLADSIHLSSTGAAYFGKRIAELRWFE
jgi:hypothetical protein